MGRPKKGLIARLELSQFELSYLWQVLQDHKPVNDLDTEMREALLSNVWATIQKIGSRVDICPWPPQHRNWFEPTENKSNMKRGQG